MQHFKAVPVNVASVDAVVEFLFLTIGTTGAVAIVAKDGTTQTYPSVPAGTLFASGKKILHSGTTASNIIAHY